MSDILTLRSSSTANSPGGRPGNSPIYDELLEPTRVHGSLYTDQRVFDDELEKIWYQGWVFVGHVSEIAKPNDFVRKHLGLQDVILTRSSGGEVHVLLNRCPHRGSTVCEEPDGNARNFRCQYHGWNFLNDGRLLGYPMPEGYGGKNNVDLGLASVPRLGVHEGFIFASLAPDGISLAEHLGGAAGEITRMARLSPVGEVGLAQGWVRHRSEANWKFIVENETDGYHAPFVHSSVFSTTESGIGALYSEKSLAVTRDLGNGHSEMDLRPEFRRLGQPMGWFGTTEERVPNYVSSIREAYGSEADEILIGGAPHVMVFPNLFIAEVSIFQIQPIAPGVTIQHVTAPHLKDAPELNRRMLQQCVGSVGPSGLLLADDCEMYERNQRGVAARQPEWIDTRRGLEREAIDSDGFAVGAATDETGIRGFWAHYKNLMTGTAPTTTPQDRV